MKKLIIAALLATTMIFAACGGTGETAKSEPAPVATSSSVKETPEATPEETEEPEVTGEEVNSVVEEAEKAAQEAVNDVAAGPDFKEVLDGYEKWVDNYCEFMKKYNNADAVQMGEMMEDYIAYASDLAEWSAKIDGYDTENLSDEDVKYYLDVTNRCNKKLLEVAG